MRRTAGAIAGALVLAVSLTGCSILEPTRDAEGRVTRTLTMPSTEAWVGDCFSYVENSNRSIAAIVPCTEQHSYLVIGKGSLSETKIALSGDLQVAVNVACGREYSDFIEAAGLADEPRASHPEQEFIVSTVEKAGGTVTNYLCAVQDAGVVASG